MNKKDKFTYAIIEAAISKGLKHIEENGNRGVRYFIDLGEHFSKGKFQKEFFDTAKKMLSDDNNKYYSIAQTVIKTIDHKILKKFGINLGYNSLTHGTKMIRENKQVFGQNIPWSVIFDFESSDYTFNSTDLSDFLYECESIGIFCCHFFAGDNNKVLNETLPILKTHENSSYFMFAKPEAISDEIIDIVLDAGNIALVLLFRPDENHFPYSDISKKLYDKKCIYGTYTLYNEHDTHYITSKENLDKYKKSNSTFVYFVDKGALNKPTNDLLINTINSINNNNEYQMYFIDFAEQIKYMNNIVSSENIVLSIDSRGFVNNLEHTNINITTHSLYEILVAINEAK